MSVAKFERGIDVPLLSVPVILNVSRVQRQFPLARAGKKRELGFACDLADSIERPREPSPFLRPFTLPRSPSRTLSRNDNALERYPVLRWIMIDPNVATALPSCVPGRRNADKYKNRPRAPPASAALALIRY